MKWNIGAAGMWYPHSCPSGLRIGAASRHRRHHAFRDELREFKGGDDHVHLLVHHPPEGALSKLVNSRKGVSSHCLRKEFPGRINRAIMHGHFWLPSSFAASCGGASLSIIRQHIEQQRRPT